MHKTLKIFILACLPLLALAGCGKSNKTIVVGASSTPHALILNETSSYISKQGYSLEVKVFNDYVLPNYALENGELDANYFQHEPYLNEFNAANGTHLVSVLKVHFEPMGIYSGNKSDLSNYVSGDKVIVPSDKSNYDRAVALLKEHGMDSANLVQVEAQNIPLMLSDCAYAVGCIDEVHEMTDSKVYDAIKQSQSTKKEPLIFIITTEGTTVDGFLDNKLAYVRKMIKGEIKDERILPWLYTQDSMDEIFNDPGSWQKSNPSLGTIKTKSYFDDIMNKARNDMATKVTMLCKIDE